MLPYLSDPRIYRALQPVAVKENTSRAPIRAISSHSKDATVSASSRAPVKFDFQNADGKEEI
jgi:hypothetical protein